MALRPTSPLKGALEYVVARPPLATLSVGGSILALIHLIGWLESLEPGFGWLAWVVPFVPPFFITNIAKGINQRRAEHDFIADAEPLIFVAYPKAAKPEVLEATLPEMLSNSAAEHLGQPLERLLEQPALALEFWVEPEMRLKLLAQLCERFAATGQKGVLRHQKVRFRTPEGERDFYLNSVLRCNLSGRLKWQATLMALRHEED